LCVENVLDDDQYHEVSLSFEKTLAGPA